MIIFLILFVPIIYILPGLLLLRHPPKSPNDLYGYRTKRASRSKHTWAYAQKKSAKIMITIGIIELALNILIVMVAQYAFSYSGVKPLLGNLSLAYALGNIILIVAITQHSLRRHFDESGMPIKS